MDSQLGFDFTDDWAYPMPPHGFEPALVACPDARPPAYQAAVGLARAGLLGSFLTGCYDRGEGASGRIVRRLAPGPYARYRGLLGRRHHPEIPVERVITAPSFDLALRVEARLGGALRRGVGQWRARRFDRAVARRIDREPPGAALLFSDVGSEHALPLCRERGVPTVLSMVHGDVREEQAVLAAEAERSPEFFHLYLGEGALDREGLAWLHRRRLRDLDLADRVLVPSEHIAAALVRHGTPAGKVAVVPYAADTERFRPGPDKVHGALCTFLFAGGITQRKGVRYLLEAWRRVRRPGWRLQLVGALPRDPGPLAPLLDGVEWLGRVGHSAMPRLMASADVFVFPSLFEGSAVVTYEALASGLASIVTPAAGSVVRDGLEGLLVPPADIEALASAMSRLGLDPDWRGEMARSARRRAEAFDWPRYHEAVVEAVAGAVGAVPAGAYA